MAYRYEETVSFSPVVQFAYLVMLGFFVWVQFQAVPQLPWVPVLVGAGLLLLPAMFGRLVFRVDEEAVTATFGLLGWPAQRILLSRIATARIVSYRPIRQFGGWGIRTGRFEGKNTSIYSVRGDRGVLLELNEPRRICGFKTARFILGTTEPERLAAAMGKPQAN